MQILDIYNISLEYRDKIILENVNFSVCVGEFFMVIGPNGAGKTSLLKVLAGLQKASESHRVVAHELRTPLSRINLALELLESDEDRRQLKSEVTEMEKIIENVDAFTRSKYADLGYDSFEAARNTQEIGEKQKLLDDNTVA